jgi:hypothetical protein
LGDRGSLTVRSISITLRFWCCHLRCPTNLFSNLGSGEPELCLEFQHTHDADRLKSAPYSVLNEVIESLCRRVQALDIFIANQMRIIVATSEFAILNSLSNSLEGVDLKSPHSRIELIRSNRYRAKLRTRFRRVTLPECLKATVVDVSRIRLTMICHFLAFRLSCRAPAAGWMRRDIFDPDEVTIPSR